MKRRKACQHTRKLKSGRRVVVNRGVRKRRNVGFGYPSLNGENFSSFSNAAFNGENNFSSGTRKKRKKR